MFERTPVVLHHDNSGFKTVAEQIIEGLPASAESIKDKTGLSIQEARKVLNEEGKTLYGRGTSIDGVWYVLGDRG